MLDSLSIVGIQIRAGDQVFEKEEQFLNNIAYFQNFFHCAEYLEEQILLESSAIPPLPTHHSHRNNDKQTKKKKKIIWYLISDSYQLRVDAQMKYGNKLITNTKDKPLHSGSKDGGMMSLRTLLAEELTLALCDYFIISHDSGVGRMAIWLSKHGGNNANRTYIEHRLHQLEDNEGKCPPLANIEFMTSAGVGI